MLAWFFSWPHFTLFIIEWLAQKALQAPDCTCNPTRWQHRWRKLKERHGIFLPFFALFLLTGNFFLRKVFSRLSYFVEIHSCVELTTPPKDIYVKYHCWGSIQSGRPTLSTFQIWTIEPQGRSGTSDRSIHANVCFCNKIHFCVATFWILLRDFGASVKDEDYPKPIPPCYFSQG